MIAFKRLVSAALLVCVEFSAAAEPQAGFRLATFSADVTVPIGHGMMGGAWLSKRIADPLAAHGLALLGGGKPIVVVAVDWCEIRNDAYARWQEVLAAAPHYGVDLANATRAHHEMVHGFTSLPVRWS